MVQLRRYRRACRGVVVVGPRGLARRPWYGAGATAQAAALYARGATSAAVRVRKFRGGWWGRRRRSGG
ncbi:MAG: hypothetical protein IT376_06190 [Polyangiaceae bacterium]|nr:hypothetical protein [Polyangiaceae bacterium]